MKDHPFAAWRAALVGAACATLLAGGAGSSPRFRAPGGSESVVEEEVRFAARVREEEKKGDDVKVDPGAARRELASTRAERTPAGLNRDRFLLEAVSYLGVPYAYGESSKDGIDCSGYTLRVYRNAANIALPRSSREQYDAGRAVERDSLQFGDLVFFNTTGSGVSHVGIYLEDTLFAHASVSYGVTISSLQSSYYRDRYLGARRVAPG
jgi:cell wall-associated NlpC family hydrolase